MYICSNKSLKQNIMVHELEKIKIGKSIDDDLMDMIVGGTSNVSPIDNSTPSADCNTYICNFKFCDYNMCDYNICEYNMCDYRACLYNVCEYV